MGHRTRPRQAKRGPAQKTSIGTEIKEKQDLMAAIRRNGCRPTGPGTITRSRGRCVGNGWRDGRLRVNDATVVVFLVLAAAISAASSSSVAALSSSSSVNSS